MATTLQDLLRQLQPHLNAGVYVFCEVPHDRDVADLRPIATFRESEGTTVILKEAAATAQRLTPVFRAAWLTLTVDSELSAVGLTAVVSAALAAAGISCNVVAAVHHDHLFVPFDQGAAALDVLEQLQRSAQDDDAID